MKRIASFVLMMVMICSACTVYAEEAQPYSDTHFQSYGISLNTIPSGGMHIIFTVRAKETAEIVGVPTYDILQKIDGEWVTVVDHLIGYWKNDAVSCVFSKNYLDAESGEKYRIRAQMYIKKYDGTSRTIDYYSQSYTLD